MLRSRAALFACALIFSAGCGAVDHALRDVDHAINQLEQANQTFGDVKDILSDLKNKLNNGTYKNQVDDLMGRASQVAQLGVQGSVDFTRARILEDLQNLRRSILNQPPLARLPILANPQSVKIDKSDASRSTLTIVGWNLDVAQLDSEKYKVVIKNDKESDRIVERKYITFNGQYAVTVDISGSGLPLRTYDRKLVFEKVVPLFEIAIVNTNPPPPPEKIVSITGLIKTTNDDREGGFAMLEIHDGTTLVWRHIFPEKPVWSTNHTEPFGFDKPMGPGDNRIVTKKIRFLGGDLLFWKQETESKAPLLLPANPQFFVVLSQAFGAAERNISWRFEANAELRTDRGNIIRFSQVGLELHCGDGEKATVNTPITRIR
jgi:hypothetical protein